MAPRRKRTKQYDSDSEDYQPSDSEDYRPSDSDNYRPSNKRATSFSFSDPIQSTDHLSRKRTNAAVTSPLRRSGRLKTIKIRAKEAHAEVVKKQTDKARRAGVEVLKFANIAAERSRMRTPMHELYLNIRIDSFSTKAELKMLEGELDGRSFGLTSELPSNNTSHTPTNGVEETGFITPVVGTGVELSQNNPVSNIGNESNTTPAPKSEVDPHSRKASKAYMPMEMSERFGEVESERSFISSSLKELPHAEIEKTGGEKPRMLLKIKLM